MCVIIVCPPQVRPGLAALMACAASNPHGAGVAWRAKGEVRWSKNLGPVEVHQLVSKLKGEVVIHFRWASVGGVSAELCHPFPVNNTAQTSLVGKAPRVLFHNGTWSGFKDALGYIEKQEKRKVGGPISDSRVMALLVNHLHDPDLLNSVEGRFVLMGATKTSLFGEWREWNGMRCSNLGFLYELERSGNPRWQKPATDQLALWTGNPPMSKTRDTGQRNTPAVRRIVRGGRDLIRKVVGK